MWVIRRCEKPIFEIGGGGETLMLVSAFAGPNHREWGNLITIRFRYLKISAGQEPRQQRWVMILVLTLVGHEPLRTPLKLPSGEGWGLGGGKTRIRQPIFRALVKIIIICNNLVWGKNYFNRGWGTNC